MILSSATVGTPANVILGKAVLCMHEMDPEWFQGYFFVPNSSKPWGLLCKQQSIDDCLKCEEGGYRELSVKVYSYNQSKPSIISDVQWTGGDMIRLLQPNGALRFEPDQALTGNEACSFVDSLFSGLLQRLKTEGDFDESSTVLDIIPDVAIVLGILEIDASQLHDSNQDD